MDEGSVISGRAKKKKWWIIKLTKKYCDEAETEQGGKQADFIPRIKFPLLFVGGVETININVKGFLNERSGSFSHSVPYSSACRCPRPSCVRARVFVSAGACGERALSAILWNAASLGSFESSLCCL